MSRIAIIVPSLGRRTIVAALLDSLLEQARQPDSVVVSVTAREDAPEDLHGADLVISEKGLCAQRNAALDRLGASFDIALFLDDDFMPASDYLFELEACFGADSSLAGATGAVLADGVTGPGLTLDQARDILTRAEAGGPSAAPDERRISLYGCNMAFRREAIEGLRFDERLPLYGWLEDVDFSVRAGRRGGLVRSARLRGVHLGVKGGRLSGVRAGYSQMMNPVYLHRKGTMTLAHAGANIGRNFLANHGRAFLPEPYVDRLGRVKGNWLAIADIVRGRITPERILSL